MKKTNLTFKERIVQHLEERGTYDPNVDEETIDDLIDNITLAKILMKDLISNGPIMEWRNSSGILQRKISPALNAYQMTMRNVYQLSSKLSLSRNDRLKLKIIDQKRQDKFDELMNRTK